MGGRACCASGVLIGSVLDCALCPVPLARPPPAPASADWHDAPARRVPQRAVQLHAPALARDHAAQERAGVQVHAAGGGDGGRPAAGEVRKLQGGGCFYHSQSETRAQGAVLRRVEESTELILPYFLGCMGARTLGIGV
mgnify:CR=1 FL=1